MGSAKPTAGYPSRTQAAAALRAEGLRDSEIAQRLGISANAVSGLLAKRQFGGDHGRRGRSIPTAGKSTRAEGIVALHQAGHTTRQIAEQLGITVSNVRKQLDTSPAFLRAVGILDPVTAGRTVHRSTEREPRRTVEIRLTDPDFACLVHLARAQRLTPTQVATDAVRQLVAQFLEATS